MPQGKIAAPRGFGAFCQDKRHSPQQAAKTYAPNSVATPENMPLTTRNAIQTAPIRPLVHRPTRRLRRIRSKQRHRIMCRIHIPLPTKIAVRLNLTTLFHQVANVGFAQ